MVQWYGAFRPAIMGGRAMVSSTHYLATAAGVEILKAGGNAVDAGVAIGLCINVLEPHLTTFGGVAPIMTWDAAARRVETISGLGRWPAAIAIDWYNENFGGDMPEGIARTVTPAAAAAWLDALARGGTMTFARVVAPALGLAEGGFPVYPRLAATFAKEAATVAGWPASAETSCQAVARRASARSGDSRPSPPPSAASARPSAARRTARPAWRRRDGVSTRATWPRRWPGTAPPRGDC